MPALRKVLRMPNRAFKTATSNKQLPMQALLILLLSLPLSCVGESPTLMQVPVIFQPLTGSQLLLPDGSTLELSEARLRLADLRLERPVESQAWHWNPLKPAQAQAHPGHEFSGNVAGELLGTYTLDLLGEPVTLGQAQLYTGTFATAQLHLPGDSQGEVLWLKGTHQTLEGLLLPVELSLSLEYEVHGIAFEYELAETAQESSLNLSLDVAHMLSFLDWSIGDEDGDGRLTLSDPSVYNPLVFGVSATPSYQLIYQAGE